MTDVITLNDRNQPNGNYLLKTFVNVCGKCYKKQMKFQQMENKLMEMEKQRMEMFMNYEDEDTTHTLTWQSWRNISKPSHPMKDTKWRILRG